jgi:glycosyltransferase involved in cell wall biosynthesis
MLRSNIYDRKGAEVIDLSVIVPVYNEGADLWPMASDLAPHLDRIVGEGKWQYVLVDNGSVDESPQVISRIISTWPQSVRLRLPRPDYGEALAQGLTSAEGSWAYIVNVDFWDDVLLRWCWKHRALYDLVLGSKRADPSLNHQHKYRRLLSWGLNSILQFAFGFVGTDTHGQKFLFLPSLRPVIAQCVMRRGQFDTELTLRTMRQGLWLAELPVPIRELRPPRNLMLKKIYRNLYDIGRLKRAMRLVPANRPIRYHRWAREDIEREASVQAQTLLESAEHTRGPFRAGAATAEDAGLVRRSRPN